MSEFKGAAPRSYEVGEKADEREFGPMTTEMFVRYSGASGDLNPMHYDRDFAEKAGYPSVFSQGMNSATLLAGFAAEWLGPHSVRRFHVRFRDIVWPGDILKCTGEVVSVVPSEEGIRVVATVALTRQTGDVALQGEVEVLTPR